ncbi:MAG: 2-isopropylmalate synthase [Nitrososphaerota archaeon]|nr:2-isopropylmalate synthase [Aigarchaeota archaeon]MDW8076444.1 2-isopropylmalate synthase [Nitrososphaerota archaeon]
MAWRSLFSEEYKLPEKVSIFDTTLRDGEQTPGVALTPEEKVEIAIQLDKLGVDIIEAGFPITSKGERKAVSDICKLGLSAKICALARCEKNDIDAAVDTGVDWVHVFLATSDIHLKYKLRMTREQALAKIAEAVEYAKSRGVIVHYSAEDATRTEHDFLMKALKVAADAGADSIDIPDTVGFAVPAAIRRLVSSAKIVTDKPVAVHCHDDMGLAVANSLSAVEAGAEIIHATVNGIGERAGNASLEEIVVALHTLYGVKTNINLQEIYKTSRLVAKLTGVWIPKNKAIVGENAFSHESGIHVHGILGSPETYEPIAPELVGRRRKIVAGKHSGIHGIDFLLKEHGIDVDKPKAKEVLEKVKALGDMGLRVPDTKLKTIAEEILGKSGDTQLVSLKELSITSNVDGAVARISLKLGDEVFMAESFGHSPVVASISALLNAVSKKMNVRLIDFRIDATSYSPDLTCEAEVMLTVDNSQEYVGEATGHDPAFVAVGAIIAGIEKAIISSVGGKAT